MSHRLVRSVVAGMLALAGFALPAGTALAQEPPPPQPVIEVGNTRFEPLFENVTLAPGERVERPLEVGGFARLSILAAAISAPNDGRLVVATIFGPPAVPVPNRLSLAFGGGTDVRRSQTMEVAGPRLTVVLVNQSRLPVDVSLSVYASK